MFRRKKTIPAALVAAAVLTLFAAGCSNESGMGNVTPVKGNLAVSFQPNPALHFVDGTWGTIVWLTETNGIGVHLYGIKFKRFSRSGQQTHEGEVEQSVLTTLMNFARNGIGVKDSLASDALDAGSLFCGNAEGNFIPAAGSACFLFDYETVFPGDGYTVTTFFGVDELGNEFTSEGRFEMIED